MLAIPLVAAGSLIVLGTAIIDFGRSRGFFGPSEDELQMNLSRGSDFSKDNLPAVGSSKGGSSSLVGWAYLLGVLTQTAGVALYVGVV